MGIFDIFKKKNIDEWVKECSENNKAVLLDVRTIQEYKEGHIPNSKNIPVQQINEIASVVTDKNTPLYVYCRSGARSGRAASTLKNMGYANAVNIGGILSYSGKVAR